MNYRILQQDIHSDTGTGAALWSGYRASIQAEYNTGLATEFGPHLFREFNRKVVSLGHTGLAFIPYDAGFSFFGTP